MVVQQSEDEKRNTGAAGDRLHGAREHVLPVAGICNYWAKRPLDAKNPPIFGIF
jgi:hypothetical protein